MTIYLVLTTVFFAGVLGGVANALMSDNGFIVPKSATVDDGRILRPGFLGNMLIGGIAAVISWGLYGPFSSTALFPLSDSQVSLSIAAFTGAILVGVGGARWLTNEVDKTLLRAAASQAAAGGANSNTAARIMISNPAAALELVAKEEG